MTMGQRKPRGLINYFAIGLTHLLMAYVAWRLLLRDDLDVDPPMRGEPGYVEPEQPSEAELAEQNGGVRGRRARRQKRRGHA